MKLHFNPHSKSHIWHMKPQIIIHTRRYTYANQPHRQSLRTFHHATMQTQNLAWDFVRQPAMRHEVECNAHNPVRKRGKMKKKCANNHRYHLDCVSFFPSLRTGDATPSLGLSLVVTSSVLIVLVFPCLPHSSRFPPCFLYSFSSGLTLRMNQWHVHCPSFTETAIPTFCLHPLTSSPL